jgi:4-amino-4-deoxy-L-arabinose transferase-like glycosyltransferase
MRWSLGWKVKDSPGVRLLWSRRAVGAALIVGAVAAGFRLHHLASIPPGLHHDEAVNGLDILVTIPRQHPIFFELNNGREPLFIYLQALVVSLLGPTTYALRLTSALVGTLTVLATYWLAREWYGRRVALLAGLGLAASFWYVDLSRVGLRAVAAPLFLTLGLLFFWRGLRTGQLLGFVLAALSFGLDLYTYSSARVIPLLAVAIVVWELARNWRGLLRRWLGLVVGVLVTVAVLAPLGAYFVGHPEFLINRADQVWIFNPNPSIEGERVTFPVNLRRTLGMFFLRGDENPRQNLPGRPVFDPIAAPFFGLGLGLTLWQALRSRFGTRPGWHGCEPDSSGWLLLWLGAILCLGVLTYESPDFLRLSALAPAVYVTWALGIAAAWRWLETRRLPHATLLQIGASLLVFGLVGYEAERTYTDYFRDWARRAEVYKAFDSGLTAAARYVELSTSPATTLVFYADRSPPVLFLSPAARSGRWLQEYSNVLLLPSNGSSIAYVYAGDGSLSDGPRLFFGDVAPVGSERDQAGDLGFLAFQLSSSQVLRRATPEVPGVASFGNATTGVDLVGYTLDSPTVAPGQRVGLTLVWKTHGDSSAVYAPYLHVVDQTGRSWGQDDRLGYTVNGWKRGDTFLSRHEWVVPVGTPPLTYRLEVGMATRAFGFPPGPSVALGPPVRAGDVRLTAPAVLARGQSAPPISHPLQANLGAGIEVLGFAMPGTTAQSGDDVPVDVLLHAPEAPARDLSFELVLVDATGHVWGSPGSRPAYGSYSTSGWPAGAVILDPRTLAVPGAAPSGEMRLSLRAIDSATQEPIGTVNLGTLMIVQPSRDYTLPTMQHRLDADFSGEIALRGYELKPPVVSPNGTVDLTLYWQGERAPARNYTVFTHLLDSANHVVAQVDSPPVHGTAPTLGWVAGQVVRDDYQLKLPAEVPGTDLVLEVGLYDAATGQRLQLAAGGGDRVILTRLPVAGKSG